MRQLPWLRNALDRSYRAIPFGIWLGLAGILGLAAGIGLFTFSYAGGLSYLSNDPKACLNCHVMRDVYEGWHHSSHKNVATCNDCHIPHNFPAKYIAKGLNGWHHSYAFTTGDFHEPIQIKKFNRDVLVQNCLGCHGELTDPVMQNHGKSEPDCLRCHSRVGHDG